MSRVRFLAVVVALVLVESAGFQTASAATVQYHGVDLDFPIVGTPYFSLTQATGISNGVAVGIAADSGPRTFFPRAAVLPARSSDHVLLPTAGGAGADAVSIRDGDGRGYHW